MDSGKQEQHATGSDQAPRHIPLGVPNIALGAEEGISLRARHDCGHPLDEFVRRADS